MDNKEPIEIQKGKTYIFKQRRTSFPKVYKGKIKEKTQFTVLIHNTDNDSTFRKDIQTFEHEFEPIEQID